MVSLLNGFSQAGQAIAGFAGTAGLAEQKSELEKQQLMLANQLQEGTQTRLAHIQGDESRQTAVTAADAQGNATIKTQDAANKLPLSAAQKSEDDYRKGTLAETSLHNRAEEQKPIPGGYSSTFMIKDPDAPGGYRQVAAEGSTFTPEMSSLMAALAERGVSLPAGLRSKQQQVSLYQGLMERNQGKTADEIADGIKAGQIKFGAEKKETQTAASIAGKVSVAENEIGEFAPLIRDASSKVDRGKFVPVNQLLQMKDASISDPNLRTLKIQINGMLNAYDVLAGRGGTDKDKRAEAHSLLTSADGPEALEAGLKAFEAEAGAAKRAARKAMSLDEAPKAAPSAADAAAAPKLILPAGVPPGSQYSPSRKQWRDVTGKFYDESGKGIEQ